ncbi:MAG: clostripain-related cysteine peptidase [Candidatus Parabeggiatoa sp.]|nr:clostripain-related cysteine peptidase [Candidatus Parabeggiatoa sp.]
MRYLLFCCYFIISPVFAIYDLVSIDITPSNEGTTFCFLVDGPQKSLTMYLALTENEQDFSFFDDKLALTPLQSDNPAPVFLTKKMRPSCFGPYPHETLQNLKLYAGAGTSFEEVLQNQDYIQFFNGFPSLDRAEKNWTVMVYIVGSSLERVGRTTKGYASQDILEMLAGTRNSPSHDINLLLSTGGSSRSGWKTVKRSLVRNGQYYVLEDLGQQAMSNPHTLTDFVNWATTEFPAQHNALILWNHGGGTQGFGQDTAQSANAKMMSLKQLHEAYQTIRQQSGKPLDIVVYDACLMASIEVAEITATVAQTLSASAELEPGHGIDYEHLLRHISTSPPTDGIAFGQVVKNGYIQHSKEQGSFEESQITYSVFDLTQLPLFTETFGQFATEFKALLQKKGFLDYQTLSRGIIRAPGYPLRQTGQLRSLRSSTDNKQVRIDLYNLLQTIGPDFDAFSESAQTLLHLLDQVIVDYEVNDNVKAIKTEAGRMSIDIGITDTGHLSTLPAAYTLFNEGLVYYDERRQKDNYKPEAEKVCPRGMTCAFAQWLELEANDILGIDAYFGQKQDDRSTIYLIEPKVYQYQALSTDLELTLDGKPACQYQLCVNDSHCEDITLTQQGQQLLADVSLNDSPAVLSFCQKAVCGVAQQIGGIWGRDDILYPDDKIIPNTLHVQLKQIEQRQGNPLTVENPEQVTLKKSCEAKKGAIWIGYYSLNRQEKIALLCDSGDCICQENDVDPGCQEIGFKAGIQLIQAK